MMKKSIIIIMFFLVAVNYPCLVNSAAEKPDTPNSVRVWRHSNTKLRIKWKKVKESDGYIIYKYNKTKKKYLKYKTINNNNTVVFIDEVGSRKSAKYKVSSYIKSGKKKVVSNKSFYVRATTYKQGDKKVNTGKVSATAISNGLAAEEVAYYETIKLKSKVKPSTYSKAKNKKTLSTNVRWYTSNPKIAIVDKNGVVTAKAKKGKCKVYARAHNGRKSNHVTINVKNYAKPDKDDLAIGNAAADPERYGFVLELFLRNYKTTTDIAEYFYINRPNRNEEFRCEIVNGEVKMTPENYVTGEMKQMIYNFVKDFPYDFRLYVTPNFVKYTEMDGITEDTREAGAIVLFLFDKNKTDPSAYTTHFELASNWIYGDFQGI